jgi:membrane protein required for colicin V production
MLAKLMRAAMLGWADRLGGAALGFVAALLAAALIVPPVLAYWPSGEGLLARSTLAPYLVAVADLATSLVPGDLSERYRHKIEGLRRQWQRPAP